MRRKAGQRVSCGKLASSLIDRLKFYFEQLEDSKDGRLASRCLNFRECAEELDAIPDALQRALISQREGHSCSAISDATDGLKSVHRVEGFLIGAELMEPRRR